jgi:hypothetical protein
MPGAAIISKPQNEKPSWTMQAANENKEEKEGETGNKFIIQPRFTAGASGDPFNNTNSIERSAGSSFIQRRCAHCEQEEEKQIQRKPFLSVALNNDVPALQKQTEKSKTARPITEEYKRDILCIGIPEEGPERAPFNDSQLRWLRAVRSSANRVLSRALTAINARDRYIEHLSQSIFQTTSLTWTFLMDTVTAIRDKLDNATFELGTCYDQSCRSPGIVAHALPDSNTIVLCRSFFLLNTTQMRRTLIHEAAHNAGIDAQRVAAFRPEFYCREDTTDCSDVCNNLNSPLTNVDAWAHFIECVAFSF